MMFSNNISSLLQFGALLGSLAPYNSKLRRFEARAWYTYTVIFIHVLMFAIFTYGKLYENDRTVTELLYSNLIYMIIFWANLYAIYSFTIGKRFWKLQKLLQLFDTLDSDLAYFNKRYAIKNVALKLCLGGIICVVVSIEDFYFWWGDEDGLSVNPFYLQDYILGVYMFYIVSLICCVLFALKKRFELLNRILKDFGRDDRECLRKMPMIEKIHTTLSDLVVVFNETFGWTMLCLVVYHIVGLLTGIEMYFFLESSGNKLFWTLFIYLMYALWQQITIAFLCECIMNEAKTTLIVSHKILMNYSNSFLLRKELFILCMQAKNRSPQFTAYGFFGVNLAMIFMFVNLFTTYLVVILQFNQSNTSM